MEKTNKSGHKKEWDRIIPQIKNIVRTKADNQVQTKDVSVRKAPDTDSFIVYVETQDEVRGSSGPLEGYLTDITQEEIRGYTGLPISFEVRINPDEKDLVFTNKADVAGIIENTLQENPNLYNMTMDKEESLVKMPASSTYIANALNTLVFRHRVVEPLKSENLPEGSIRVVGTGYAGAHKIGQELENLNGWNALSGGYKALMSPKFSDTSQVYLNNQNDEIAKAINNSKGKVNLIPSTSYLLEKEHTNDRMVVDIEMNKPNSFTDKDIGSLVEKMLHGDNKNVFLIRSEKGDHPPYVLISDCNSEDREKIKDYVTNSRDFDISSESDSKKNVTDSYVLQDGLGRQVQIVAHPYRHKDLKGAGHELDYRSD